MHEIEAVQSVINELKKKKPKRAKVVLGMMRGNPKTFRSVFRVLVKGTGLEKVKLEIRSVPVEINCLCGFKGKVEIPEHIHFVRCPRCGNIADVLKGDELKIII